MRAGRLHTHGAKAAGEGINKSIMMEAVTFQMTWPGAPTVYYGDEVSVVGWTDPDNRRTYPWGKEDLTMLNFHKAAIALRKRYAALRTGSVEFLYSRFGILTYARWDEKNRLVIVLNNNNGQQHVSVPVWKAEVPKNSVMKRVLYTANDGFSTEEERYVIKNGCLELDLMPFSSMVFVEV